jgi:hypothetical protein
LDKANPQGSTAPADEIKVELLYEIAAVLRMGAANDFFVDRNHGTVVNLRHVVNADLEYDGSVKVWTVNDKEPLIYHGAMAHRFWKRLTGEDFEDATDEV